MRLGLSSAAAPGIALPKLLEACRARGITQLEVVLDATSEDGPSPAAFERERLDGPAWDGVRLAGLALHSWHPDCGEQVVRLASALEAPLLVEVADLLPGEVDVLLRRSVAAKVRVLLVHGTNPRAALRLRRLVSRLPRGAAGLAWQIDPAIDDPLDVPAVLVAAGTDLDYVRLRGGGPETVRQTGLGIGAVMARLALVRYAGPLVMTPSASRHQRAWRDWVNGRGGSGCGSKKSDPALVQLQLTVV
jgi:hypothetical protein